MNGGFSGEYKLNLRPLFFVFVADSYGLYVVSIVTFISYMWSISLSIKLRNFDMVDIRRYIEDYKIAAKVSKAGLIMELVMVFTVSVRQACMQCSNPLRTFVDQLD